MSTSGAAPEQVALSPWEESLLRVFQSRQPGIQIATLEEDRALHSLQAVTYVLAKLGLGARDIVRWSTVSCMKYTVVNPEVPKDLDGPQGHLPLEKRLTEWIREPSGNEDGGIPGIFLAADVEPLFERNYGLVRLFRESLDAILHQRLRKTIIILNKDFTLPPELRRDFMRFTLELPDVEGIGTVVQGMFDGIRSKNAEKLAKAHVEPQILRGFSAACSGLTERECRGLFVLSMAKYKAFDERAVVLAQKEKARILLAGGALAMQEPRYGFSDVGGLENAKAWAAQVTPILTNPAEARAFGLRVPSGLLLIGIPGCLHGSTKIYDPVDKTTLTVKQRWAKKRLFHVLSLGPEGVVVTAACAPIKYSAAQMIRFYLEDGEQITVTPQHRFLQQGTWRYASEVYESLSRSGDVRLCSISDISRLAHVRDAFRWRERVPGSPVDCLRDLRFGDERLLQVGDVGQEPIPSQVGVRERTRRHLRSDGQEARLEYIQSCPYFGPQSKRNFQRQNIASLKTFHLGNRCQESEGLCRRDLAKNRCARQSGADASLADKVEHTLGDVGQSKFVGASVKPSDGYSVRYTDSLDNMEERRVVKAEVVASSAYYDFHVPVYNNYYAHGVWNHNCGKSLISEALAKEWCLPLLRFDVGAAFGSFVGESEKNIRRMIEIANALKPCMVFIDEIEKGFGADSHDGGTTARVKSTLLTWLQDKPDSIFVVATANDLNKLSGMPELIRSGRFDQQFFVDLPDAASRQKIFEIHFCRAGHKVEADTLREAALATPGYSGAEIEVIVQQALRFAFAASPRGLTKGQILRAVVEIKPLSATMAESIARLRAWCHEGRAKPAGAPLEGDSQSASRSAGIGDLLADTGR